MFMKVFYIVAAINNTVNVDHRFTSAGWMIQGLKTFYKCWLEFAGFFNIVYKCWLEDTGYEYCLQMLAGGLQSLNTVYKR
jgi:hypothetical protein